MKLEKARDLAQEIQDRISPLCFDGKCVVAGSIRREMPEVGDIEIVCIPKPERFSAFVAALGMLVSFKTKVTKTSRYVKCWLPVAGGMGIQVDVFIPMAYDWGRQLAIRTGSANYSAMLAAKWNQMGYHGTSDGLLPAQFCERVSGNSWKPKPNINPVAIRKEFPEETDLFDFLRIEYVLPKFRNK